jgi:hypothetical protein
VRRPRGSTATVRVAPVALAGAAGRVEVSGDRSIKSVRRCGLNEIEAVVINAKSA